MKGLIGKKVGMSQLFTTNGELIPVTMIEIEPNVIMQVKNKETDGYSAIQLGVEDKRSKLSTKADLGHAKKANLENSKRKIKEFLVDEAEINNYNIGEMLTVDVFAAGDIIDVQGTSKGKGFQGVIKRHNHSRGPMSHGSRHHRRPGSMGAVAPQPFKGKKLPGQMGDKTVTAQNLEIVLVDKDKNTIVVKGNIPGAKKSFVCIKEAIKNKVSKEKRELVSYDKKETEAKE